MENRKRNLSALLFSVRTSPTWGVARGLKDMQRP